MDDKHILVKINSKYYIYRTNGTLESSVILKDA
jgi:hypothetical protein